MRKIILCILPLFISLHTIGQTTFHVTNGNDYGVGSLRQAIADARMAGDNCTIVFDSNFQLNLLSEIVIDVSNLTINGNSITNGNIIYGNGSSGSEINSTAALSSSYNVVRGATLPGMGNVNLSADKGSNLFDSATDDAATLADNGGPTETINLSSGSYAQNIPTSTNQVTSTDQRDMSRPVGCGYDAGSVELQTISATTPSQVRDTSLCAGSLLTKQILTRLITAPSTIDTSYYVDRICTTPLTLPFTVARDTPVYVKFVSTDNCSDTLTIHITQKQLPLVTVNSPVTVCTPATVNVAGSATGAATYRYYSDAACTNELGSTIFSGAQTTSYWVIGTSAQGCTSAPAQGTVAINEKPTIIVTSPNAVCDPMTVDVAGSATGAATYRYYSDAACTIELGSTIFTGAQTTNYRVKGTSAQGCVSDAVQGTVTINAKPVITVTSPVAVCAPATVDVAGTATGAATYAYYSDAACTIPLGSTIFTGTQTTNYWVKGTSAQGCVSDAVMGMVTITGGLAGDYIVGNVPGADFPTLKAAADKYNNCGIRANSRLIVSSDISETQQVEFLGSAPGSTSYMLTITSDGTRRIITGNLNTSLVKFTAANNIIIDGQQAATEASPTAPLLVFNNTYTTVSSTVRALSVDKDASNNSGKGVRVRNSEFLLAPQQVAPNGGTVVNVATDSLWISNSYVHSGYTGINGTTNKFVQAKGNIVASNHANGIYIMPSTIATAVTVTGNVVKDMTPSTGNRQVLNGIYLQQMGGTGTWDISSNKVDNLNNQAGFECTTNAMYIYSSATLKVNGNQISNITNNSTSTGFALQGLQIYTLSNSFECYNNTVYNLNSESYAVGIMAKNMGGPLSLVKSCVVHDITGKGVRTNSYYNSVGIYISGQVNMNANTVSNIKNIANNANASAIGIFAESVNLPLGYISNNMVSDVAGRIGIGISAYGNISLYHNTVRLITKLTDTDEATAINIGDRTKINSTTARLKNNILSNEISNGHNSNYLVKVWATPSPTISDNRYNITNGNIGYADATTTVFPTLSGWATAMKDNSFLVEPTFAAANNLHLAAPSTIDARLHVPLLATVPADFDNDPRSSCINAAGADNFTASPEFIITNVQVINSVCPNTSTTVRFEALGGLPAFQYKLNGASYSAVAVDSVTRNGTYAMHITAIIPDGSYTLQLKDGNSCNFTPYSPVQATNGVYATATIAPANTNLCPGENATLQVTLTGVAPFKLYYSENGVPNSTTTSSNLATLSYSNVIANTIVVLDSLVDKNGMGCMNRTLNSQAQLTVLPVPVPTITGNATVCANATSERYSTESGMSAYQWNVVGGTVISGGSATDNYVTVNWGTAGSGSVSVSYTNSSGCTAASPYITNVTMLTKPVITVTSPAAVCAPATVDVAGTATGATTYKYYADNTGTVGAELGSTVISTVGTTSYWVIGTSAQGCVSDAVMGTVTINTKPVIVVTSPAAVCSPSTVDVAGTATGATTYKYYSDATCTTELGSTIISMIGTTSYWVIGTSAQGCVSDAVQGTVTINAKPVIIVTSPAAVCSPSTVDVAGTATGVTTYKYYADNTGTVGAELGSTVISTVGTTSYWVIGTSAQGCVSDAVMGTVTINTKPVIVVTSPAAVCSPSTVDVAGTATGATTYKYHADNTGTVGAELGSTVISTVGTTNYWVIGTSAQGCVSDAVMGTVTINTKPVIVVTSPAAVCSPSTVDVAGTAIGATTYKYYSDATCTTELGSTIISTIGTTSYWVIGTSAQGCVSDAVQGTVTINAMPVIVVTSPAAVCSPSTVDIAGTATGATTYKYHADNTGTVGAELGSMVISTVGTTNYWVIGTSAQGCVSDAVMGTVTIYTLVTPTINGSQTVCANATGLTYSTESGMSSYQWTVNGGTLVSGQNSNNIVVSWGSTGTGSVSVRYTNSSGCTSELASYNITIDALPNATITGETTICAETTNVTYSTENGMSGYQWHVSGGNITGGQGTSSINVSWNTEGTGSVRVSYTLIGGCDATTSVNVTVNPKPAIPVINMSTINGSGIVNVTLTATSSGQAYSNSATYIWYRNGSPVGGQTGSTLNFTETQPCTYGVMVTDNGCTSAISTAVNVTPSGVVVPATISMNPNSGIICGTGNVTLSANPSGGTYSGTETYTWYKNGVTVSGQTDATLVVTEKNPGIYTVMVADQGVSSTVSSKVEVKVIASITLYAHDDISGGKQMLGKPITINVTPTGLQSYTYSFNGKTATQAQSSYLIYQWQPKELNTVTISAKLEGECIVNVNYTFTGPEYDLPNIIVPGGPEPNDKLLRGYEIRVFNRWGSELYHGKQGWDGTYKGKRVTPGTYFYTITIDLADGSKMEMRHYVYVKEQ